MQDHIEPCLDCVSLRPASFEYSIHLDQLAWKSALSNVASLTFTLVCKQMSQQL